MRRTRLTPAQASHAIDDIADQRAEVTSLITQGTMTPDIRADRRKTVRHLIIRCADLLIDLIDTEKRL